MAKKTGALRSIHEQRKREKQEAIGKTQRIGLRLSQQERDSIELAANAEGLKLTEYLLALHWAHLKGKKIIQELGK